MNNIVKQGFVINSTTMEAIQNGLPGAEAGQDRGPPRPFFTSDNVEESDSEDVPEIYRGDDDDYCAADVAEKIPTRRYDDFCSVKCDPIFYAHRDKARLIPICCPYCLPKSKAQISEINKERYISNCLLLKEEMEPSVRWYTNWVPYVLKYFWRRSCILNQCDTVTIDDVTNDPELTKNITEYTKMSKEDQLNVKSKIISFIENICVAPLGKIRSMLSSWATRMFLKCMFSAVFIHTGQIDHLKTTQDKGLPLIFIPLYRGVLDPVILSWVLTHNSIRSPFFFSGHSMRNDSLLKKLVNLTGVGLELRSLESDSLPVNMKHDIVHAGVSSYLKNLLIKNNNFEIILEPRRSRSGLPSTYIYGRELLEILINLFESKQIEDAFIIPVCTSYEKLPEEEEYLEGFDSNVSKVKGRAFLNMFWSCLLRPATNVRVDFGQPFSLREFKRELSACMKWAEKVSYDDSEEGLCLAMHSSELRWDDDSCSISSLPSFYGELSNFRSDCDITAAFVNLLANHAIYDASKCGAIMSTHIIAFLLVKKYPNGLEFGDFVKEFDSFKILVKSKNRDLGFRGNTEDIIERAIGVLGPHLVSVKCVHDKKFIKAVDTSEGRLQLSYYSNHAAPLFTLEAVFATVLFSICEKSITVPAFASDRVIVIPMKEFAHAFKQVYKLLKSEFLIHPPCKNINDGIEICLDEFQTRGIIRVVEKKRNDKNQESDDDWDDDAPLVDRYKLCEDDIFLNLSHKTIDSLMFWKSLIMGYFEVYRTSSLQLFSLLPNEEMEESEMLKQMLELSLQYSRKEICEDVLSINTIKNFVNRLMDLKILEYYNIEDKRYFYITEDFASLNDIEKLYGTLDRYVFYP